MALITLGSHENAERVYRLLSEASGLIRQAMTLSEASHFRPYELSKLEYVFSNLVWTLNHLLDPLDKGRNVLAVMAQKASDEN